MHHRILTQANMLFAQCLHGLKSNKIDILTHLQAACHSENNSSILWTPFNSFCYHLPTNHTLHVDNMSCLQNLGSFQFDVFHSNKECTYEVTLKVSYIAYIY